MLAPTSTSFLGFVALALSLSTLVACDDPSSKTKAVGGGEKASTPQSMPSSKPAPKAAAHSKKAPSIKAHQAGFKAAKAPAGAWTIDAAGTDVSFTIVSKSAGPVSGTFPKGVTGFVSKDGKGEVVIDLATLVTTGKDGGLNAVRNARVVHAFFGVPLSAAKKENAEASKAAMKKQAAVDVLWKKLEGVLPAGVANAAYRIQAIEGLDKLEEGKAGTLKLHGTLILWDSLETHFMLKLKATQKGKTLQASSVGPATVNLEKLLGKTTRDLVFETMLAAGAAHQAGVHSEVMINIPKLTLVQK